MKYLFVLRTRIIPVFLLLSSLLFSQISFADDLFNNRDVIGGNAVNGEEQSSRARSVIVNTEILTPTPSGDYSKSESSLDSTQTEISLTLFDDTTVNAVLDRTVTRANGNFTWFGHLLDIPLSSVVLVVHDEKITGTVVFPGGNYQIRPTDNDLHRVFQVDESLLPEQKCVGDHGQDSHRSIQHKDHSKSLFGAQPFSAYAAGDDDGSEIDIIVLYTAGAAEDSTDIVAEAQLMIDNANQTFINSNINTQLRLVHHQEVAYDASEWPFTILGDLKDPTDGELDIAHILRAKYNADLVTLLVKDMELACGIGYIMQEVDPVYESEGFNVVKQSCNTLNYVVAHEIGHNLGARHDRYVDPTDNSPFTYNHGYVNVAQEWRTVMAYESECKAADGTCGWIPYWSNPDIEYDGYAIGIPEGNSEAADNHKALNNTIFNAANYRSSTATITMGILPTVHEFGMISSGGEATHTFHSFNASDHDLIVNTISITGAGADDFSISEDECSGTTLAPDAFCSFTVTFSSTNTGQTMYGQINMSSSTAGIEDVSAEISGWVPDTTLTIDTSDLDDNMGAKIVSSDGIISCGQGHGWPEDCTKEMIAGDSVTLSLGRIAGGTIFTGWSGGGCSGTEDCTTVITEDTTINAHFTSIDRVSLPFTESFEDLVMAKYYEENNSNDGRIRKSFFYGAVDGTMCITFDSGVDTEDPARNELILTADLEGADGVNLSFYHKEWEDDTDHVMPDSFTGSHNSDGVAISADGTHWHKIQGLTSGDGIGTSFTRFTVDLDSAIAAAGISYNNDFKIKFQRYDYGYPTDAGFALDYIRLTGNTNQVECEYTLDPESAEIDSQGGSVVVSITASDASCQWSASESTDWITIDSGNTGTGSGSVEISVTANSSGGSRDGVATIAGQTFPITQEAAAGCNYSLSTTEVSFSENGGSQTIDVTVQTGCPWTATSNNSWITIDTGDSGTGSGSVTFTVSANNTASARVGTVVVDDQVVLVTQAQADPTTVVTESGSIQRSQWHHFGPYTADEGDFAVEMTGTGDVDLYVRKGSQPTSRNYDCRPYKDGSNESCTITGPGEIYVSVYGYDSSSTYELEITYERVLDEPTCDEITTYAVDPSNDCYQAFDSACDVPDGWEDISTTIPQGVSKCPNVVEITVTESATIAKNAWDHYGPYDVYEGDLQVTMTGNNDADLYVRQGSQPTSSSYDCRPYDGNSNESCTVSGPGDIYVSVNGYATSSTYNLSITYRILEEDPCTYELSSTEVSLNASGGSSSVDINTTSECAWTAGSNVTWITVDGGEAGTGNGTVSFSVDANTNANDRTGTLNIAGQVFTISQAGLGCSFSLNETSVSMGADGGTGSVTVDSLAGCNWTASSNTSWITISSGTNGSGEGTVNYTVEESNTSAERSGTLTIAGETFTVNQEGQECSYSLSATSATMTSGADTGTVSINAPIGCVWATTSNNPWISITSGESGNGNGTVEYSITANETGTERTGTLSIAGLTYTINQADLDCTYSLSATSTSIDADGGTGSVSVSVSDGCDWSAASNDSWISITNGDSGNGDGTVSYSVQNNPEVSDRNGTMTIAGQTFTVNQDGISCTYSLSVTTINAYSSGGSYSIDVNATEGCGWNHNHSNDWITVVSGGSGDGNGTMHLTVAENTGTSSRTGSINVAGRTLTINQEGITPPAGNIAPDADATAQSSYSNFPASHLNDDNHNTNWYSQHVYSSQSVWVRLEWDGPQNVNNVEISWVSNYRPGSFDFWTRQNDSWTKLDTFTVDGNNTTVNYNGSLDAIWILLKNGNSYFGIQEIEVQ